MDCVTLLERAIAGGLSVKADGDRLVIKGPRRAADLAQELMVRKAEVLDLLAMDWHASTTEPEPAGPVRAEQTVSATWPCGGCFKIECTYCNPNGALPPHWTFPAEPFVARKEWRRRG